MAHPRWREYRSRRCPTRPIPPARGLLAEMVTRGNLAVGGLEEFGDLAPVERMWVFEAQREPAAIAVVR